MGLDASWNMVSIMEHGECASGECAQLCIGAMVSLLALLVSAAGDLLRDEVESGSELGRCCDEMMKEGTLVPQEVGDQQLGVATTARLLIHHGVRVARGSPILHWQ